MTGITILKSNVPHGPFTRAEIAQKLAAGEITPESLAFVEGLTQWTPLRDVLARVDAMPSPHAPIETGFGMEPGTAPAVAAPAYLYAASMAPPSHFVYAGFWLRVGAILIDGLILSPLAVISFALNAMVRAADSTSTELILSLVSLAYSLLLLVVRWLYFALQESSGHQATVGKRVVGIYVTNRQGQRITFGRATGRYFAKIISTLTLCIGFMMAGWTERKQALHDLIADTLVVRKPTA